MNGTGQNPETLTRQKKILDEKKRKTLANAKIFEELERQADEALDKDLVRRPLAGTANCICEIHCLAQDGFDLNTVHKLSSQEWKISAELGLEPRAAGWEAILKTQSPFIIKKGKYVDTFFRKGHPPN